MPEEVPPPGTACIVIDCDDNATLYMRVTDTAPSHAQNSIAMCDEHATNWRDGDVG